MIDAPLRDNIGIGDVSGGERSNPLWEADIGNDEFRVALRRSLDSAGVLERARGEGRYVISAVLESIELPGAGLLSVTTRVTYTLIDKQGGKEVFRNPSPESIPPARRIDVNRKILREADGCIRANTGRLAESLWQPSPSQSEVSSLQ